MKKRRWFKRKAFIIPCVIVAVLLIASGVYAAVMFTVNIPSTLQIIAPSPDYTIGVYSDAGCTQVVSSINWGQVEKDGTATRTVYVKNLGNQTTNIMTTSSLDSSEGTITANSFSLAPDVSGAMNILLTVKHNSHIGSYTFTIYVNSNS